MHAQSRFTSVCLMLISVGIVALAIAVQWGTWFDTDIDADDDDSAESLEVGYYDHGGINDMPGVGRQSN